MTDKYIREILKELGFKKDEECGYYSMGPQMVRILCCQNIMIKKGRKEICFRPKSKGELIKEINK